MSDAACGVGVGLRASVGGGGSEVRFWDSVVLCLWCLRLVYSSAFLCSLKDLSVDHWLPFGSLSTAWVSSTSWDSSTYFFKYHLNHSDPLERHPRYHYLRRPKPETSKLLISLLRSRLPYNPPLKIKPLRKPIPRLLRSLRPCSLLRLVLQDPHLPRPQINPLRICILLDDWIFIEERAE